MKKERREVSQKPRGATYAVHGRTKDGAKHVVGIGNLRVVLVPDGEGWFAQGLELDYAASGSSLEDVQKRFEDGLWATIDWHLKIYGSIEKILKIAPASVWCEFLFDPKAEPFRFTQVSLHRVKKQQPISVFPFTGITYLKQTEMAA